MVVVTVIFLKNLKAFFKKYPEKELVELNEEFRNVSSYIKIQLNRFEM